MTIEIRPAQPEEMELFRDAVAYAFADHRRTTPTIAADWSMCAFDDGKLVTTSGVWPFQMRINGGQASVGGVTMVSTRPSHRRQGLLSRVMARSLREQRERGQYLSALWASFGAIYQRFGFGLASMPLWYQLDPRLVRLHAEPESGSRVELYDRTMAMPMLKALYVAHATPRNLFLHRGQPMWDFMLREVDGVAPHIAIHRTPGGSPTGYVIYETHGRGGTRMSVDDAPPNQEIQVRDLVALDAPAWHGLWAYLRAHDLVRSIRVGPLADDDPAPLLTLEPRQLRARTEDSIWLRVVDVERALALRPYGAAGQLAIEIGADPTCDWNVGCFRLETDGRTSTVKRCSDVPDLVLSPRALATLFAGHRSATQLFRAGLLDARDPTSLALADALFRTEHRPHCPDMF